MRLCGLLVPVLWLAGLTAAWAQPGVIAGRMHQPALEDPSDGTPDFMALTGALNTLVQVDRLGRTAGGPPATQAFNKTSLYARIWLPEGLAITGFFRFEPAPRSDPGDRIFTDHTGWVDSLYARWSLGVVSVFGGKIHPRFGLAWANAPGLYGNDIATDYEMREKLGIGMRIWLSDLLRTDGAFGQHSLQGEVFTADTSGLSNGAFARRFATPATVTDPVTGETTTILRRQYANSRTVGTADNVDGPGGVVLSLAGVHVPLPLGELGYALAWSSRRPGSDAAAAGRSRGEGGMAASAFHSLPLSPDLQLSSLAEYVRQWDSGGFQRAGADWLTASTTLQAGPYALSLTMLRRRRDDPVLLTKSRLSEQIVSFAADLGQVTGYALLSNVTAAADWRRISDEGRVTQGVGAGVIWSGRF
jgi:hypothetical protein